MSCQGHFYDPLGSVTQIVFPDTSDVDFEYDPRFAKVTKFTDQLTRPTRFEYNAMGQLKKEISTINSAEIATLYDYDSFGNLKEIKEEPRPGMTGSVTTLEYTDNDQPKKITFPDLKTNQFTYDPAGNLATTTNEVFQVTTLEWDALNQLRKTTRPGGVVQQFDYDLMGNLKSYTDAENRLTSFTYGPLDLPVSRTNALWGRAKDEYAFGFQVSSADENSHTSRYGYNLSGQMNAVTNPLQKTTTIGHDTLGRTVTVTDPLSRQRVFTYDPLDRIKTETAPGESATTYNYFSTGTVRDIIDPAGNRTVYEYDEVDRPKKTTAYVGYDSQPRETNYKYLYAQNSSGAFSGYETRIIDPLTNETAYTFDKRGRLIKLTPPPGSGVASTQWAYFDDGKLKSCHTSRNLCLKIARKV